MDIKTITRALIEAAYEQGWRDACDDSIKQDADPHYPIGRGKRGGVDDVLLTLDPRDLLGLQGGAR